MKLGWITMKNITFIYDTENYTASIISLPLCFISISVELYQLCQRTVSTEKPKTRCNNL